MLCSCYVVTFILLFWSLVIQGTISEEKVDSFNLPLFNASFQHIEGVVKQNGCFTIEMVENIPQVKPQPKVFASTMRSGMEGMTKGHFGDEFNLDELFDLLSKKFEESLISTFEQEKALALFVLLKRVANN